MTWKRSRAAENCSAEKTFMLKAVRPDWAIFESS